MRSNGGALSRDRMGDSILSEKVPANARSEMFLRKSRFTCVAPPRTSHTWTGLRVNLFPVARGDLSEHEFVSERADFRVFDKQGEGRGDAVRRLSYLRFGITPV